MGEILPDVILARTGRQRQRYDEKLRLVAGEEVIFSVHEVYVGACLIKYLCTTFSSNRCIPYRLKPIAEDGTNNLLDRLEVVMISSPNQHDLVFPKGGWENDETLCEAACREALEEAGVRGIINEIMLGEWTFRSKRRKNSLEGACKGYMFALKVTEELQTWPEQSSHERRWLCLSEAWQLCRYNWMREALAAFVWVISGRTLLLSADLTEPLSKTIPEQVINAWC